MQCDARSQVNQGESEGVDLGPRLKMSPQICQEIAHNAPPSVVFYETAVYFLPVVLQITVGRAIL